MEGKKFGRSEKLAKTVANLAKEMVRIWLHCKCIQQFGAIDNLLYVERFEHCKGE